MQVPYPSFKNGNKLTDHHLDSLARFLMSQAGLASVGACAGRWGLFRPPNADPSSPCNVFRFETTARRLTIEALCLLTPSGLSVISDRVSESVPASVDRVFIEFSLLREREGEVARPEIRFAFAPPDGAGSLWTTEVVRIDPTSHNGFSVLAPAITLDASTELQDRSRAVMACIDGLATDVRDSQRGDVAARSQVVHAALMCVGPGTMSETTRWLHAALWAVRALRSFLDVFGGDVMRPVTTELDRLLELPRTTYSELSVWLGQLATRLSEDGVIRRWFRRNVVELHPLDESPLSHQAGNRLYRYVVEGFDGRVLLLQVAGVVGPPPNVRYDFSRAPERMKVLRFLREQDEQGNVLYLARLQVPVAGEVLLISVPETGKPRLSLT